MTKQITTAAAVVKAAGSALSAGMKAGEALRAYVGFVECSTAADMARYEVAYKALLADTAYTGAPKDVQAKIRRLMTDAVRGKAGYSVDKAGAIMVKAKADTKAAAKSAPGDIVAYDLLHRLTTFTFGFKMFGPDEDEPTV